MSMNVFPVWIYVNAWYQQRPEEAFRYPHCGIIGSCKAPDMDTGTQTQIPCKSSAHS